jgi:hypothetical protein
MRNIQFFNRVAPCLAVLTIGSFAALALPATSFAAASPQGMCRPTPPNGGPNMRAHADGSCPMNYSKVEMENPGAINDGGQNAPNAVAVPGNGDGSQTAPNAVAVPGNGNTAPAGTGGAGGTVK